MKYILLAALFVTSIAHGQIPQYATPELLARSSGLGNFNLPPMTFFTNSTPIMNNQGDVSFKLIGIEGEAVEGIWYKAHNQKKGTVVFRGPEFKVVTDPFLNDHGKVSFSIFDEVSSDGIFVFDASTQQTRQVLDPAGSDLKAHLYSQILNDDQIIFRGTHESEDHTYFSLSESLTPLLTEGESFSNFQASYLFGPVVNNHHQWAFKIRVGERKEWGPQFPDQIILLNPDGSSRQVAVDQKTDPQSPYSGFMNSVGLSENGKVVFVAILTNGKMALVLDDHGQQFVVASEDNVHISAIELFSPRVNSQGVVAFRAIDANGKRAIFLATKSEIHRLLGEGDPLPTDLGPARVAMNPHYPAFGGSISLNEKNEICFSVVIESLDGQEILGSAIYKQQPLSRP